MTTPASTVEVDGPPMADQIIVNGAGDGEEDTDKKQDMNGTAAATDKGAEDEEAGVVKAEDGGETEAADEEAEMPPPKTPTEAPSTPTTSASSTSTSIFNPVAATSAAKPKRSATGGGLGALAARLCAAKKPKKAPSVLDKSAQDWRAFVREEKLEEEMDAHLRSRDAFLDKQEFLLRADYSQFEKERDLRAQGRRVQEKKPD